MSEKSSLGPAVQVAPEHYDFERYDDLERWISYWYQIRAVMRLRPRTVLEIGSGTGVVRSYLRNAGIQVQSVDIDESRKPDLVADVSDLDAALPTDLRFDAICAFQVLEHLPFDRFERCLDGLARHARHALISLPYRGERIRLSFWLGDRSFSIGHKFMMPWRYRPCREHHWELGRGFSARRITRIMARYFDVLERGFIKENPYHYLWVLRSRGAPGS
ncbi:MAG TPA: methyltransferase domain-containing protein [Candidatus Acidoferrum sp.]|nr:methyltransferase domain-containing protein [Candidatus Acidoferrum sp.]